MKDKLTDGFVISFQEQVQFDAQEHNLDDDDCCLVWAMGKEEFLKGVSFRELMVSEICKKKVKKIRQCIYGYEEIPDGKKLRDDIKKILG